MGYSYQRGGDMPKSTPFLVQVTTRKSREYYKGRTIIIDGGEFVIASISRVEVGGDLVKIIGKCKPKGVNKHV